MSVSTEDGISLPPTLDSGNVVAIDEQSIAWKSSRHRALGRAVECPQRGGRRRVLMLRVVLIVGLIIFAAFARRVFVPAMQSLRHPHWGWVPVAIVAETASMAAFMRMQRQTLIQGGVKIPVRSAIAITYASNAMSVTVPVAGGTASTAFTVKQFSHHGASPALITWALGMSGIISTAAFALAVGVTGMVGGGGYTALIGAAVAVVGVVPIGVLFVMLHREHSRALLERLLAKVLGRSQRLINRPRGDVGTMASEGIERFVTFRLHRRGGAVVLAFALLNWVADGLCLAAAIEFVGQPVPWASLSLIYTAGVGAAAIGITPAGIGVVETAIAASLVAVGMKSEGALPAALLYRGISCWLVLGVGWIIYINLRRDAAAEAAESASAGRHRTPDVF